jgi:hypothetical protein
VQTLLVGRELQAALDTRASANFINGRIIKPQTRRRTTVQLAGEDSTIPSTDSATLEVTIGNQTYTEEFLVVDQLSVDVILGHGYFTDTVGAKAKIVVGSECR